MVDAIMAQVQCACVQRGTYYEDAEAIFINGTFDQWSSKCGSSREPY
jgi:hypothetical protein